MPNIHQLLAGAGTGDAITNYAFEIQKILIDLGFTSDIFAPYEHISKEHKNGAIKNITEYSSSESDILLYHYSIGSKATNIYLNAKCHKCLCYHNITPGKYFRNISITTAANLDKGRIELQRLASSCEIAISDSSFNSMELIAMGFKNTEVVPIKFPREYLNTEPDNKIMENYCDGKTNLLFVGRIVPNKRFEDLIKTFYFYNKTVNRNSKLILVGSYIGNEVYYHYLKTLVATLSLIDSVIFTGHIYLNTLIAYYRSAAALLCLSEHEGFCLPLLEAMQFNLPVFALKQAAVPETMGNSGVLFEELDYVKISEIIGFILENPMLVEKILKRQQMRLMEFNSISIKERLLKIFEKYCILN